MLSQSLKDPEVTGGTVMQMGYAFDVNGRVKYNRTRFRADFQVRDLAFILHSTPSLPTFSDFPEEYDISPNLFAAVGVDHNFAGTGLTLGVIAGIDFPATLETPTGTIPGDMVGGSGTSVAVVRNEGDITVLPEDEEALPQYAAKFTGASTSPSTSPASPTSTSPSIPTRPSWSATTSTICSAASSASKSSSASTSRSRPGSS